MNNTQQVILEKEGIIARIQLMRPDKRNALNDAMISEMQEAVNNAEQDKKLRVVIIQGDSGAFCAGADLEYLQALQQYSREENIEDSLKLKHLYHSIYLSSKIYIAQVEGPALAGGCGLASVCDYIFATTNASFGYTESRIGFIPAIVMVYLIRKIGEGKARHLLLSGEILDTEKAFKIGLVHQVCNADQIQNEVIAFAMKLAKQCSGNSIALIKKMIGQVQDLPLDKALQYASEMNAEARSSDDCKKGIAAFLNKERIQWSH